LKVAILLIAPINVSLYVFKFNAQLIFIHDFNPYNHF